MSEEELKVQDGQVVSMEYALHVDGELIDQSEKDEPLEFIQGEGHIIPGLEQAIYGLTVGDAKSVVVSAKEGYGEFDAEAFTEVPRDQFPSDFPLNPGVELQVKTDEGEILAARIESVGDEAVRLDFNHPLAGKELHFAIKVLALRQATDEEIAHGHVHGDHGHDEDEDE
jgi:FKBP-type peptidyl-prolyl cis-trans isomerase SlyD